MKRKLLIVSVLAFAMLGLTSCSSEHTEKTESATTIETVQNTDGIESSSKETEQQSEAVISETSTEAATENNSDEEGSGEVTWYMDSDGLKNDELGIVIRKNNDEGRVLEIQADLWLEAGRAGFYCDYYDGDIDTYISEHPIVYGTYHVPEWDVKQKASIGDIEYAYSTYSIGSSSSALVTFVGNGIAVSAVLFYDENETYEDCLNRLWDEDQGIKLCDEFKMDCLAYLTDNGLYCPALGMKFTSTDIAGLVAICGWKDSSFGGGRPADITFREGVMGVNVTAENAQDAVEKDIENMKESNEDENVSIGKIGTRDFGKYTYYGLERTYPYGSGEQCFYADNAGWYIEYLYMDEAYKDYIDCIENLE